MTVLLAAMLVRVVVRDEGLSIEPPVLRAVQAPRSRSTGPHPNAPFELVVRGADGTILHRMPFDVPIAITVPPAPPGVAGDDAPSLVPLGERAVILRVPYYPDARVLEVYRARQRSPAGIRMLERPPVPPAVAMLDERAGRPAPATSSAQQLDVLIIASGFTASEMPRFRSVSAKIRRFLLSRSPFAAHRRRVRIRRFENTAPLGCAPGCAGIARLICCDFEAVIAAGGDSDEIIVVHNAPYGGSGALDGGIGFETNSYSTFAVTYGAHDDFELQHVVAVHEFGHSFGNLCDEYSYGPSDDVGDVVCVNCRPECGAWRNLDRTCEPGCASHPEFARPRPSIMLTNDVRRFNKPSIAATYFPFGLRERLRFFLGELPRSDGFVP